MKNYSIGIWGSKENPEVVDLEKAAFNLCKSQIEKYPAFLPGIGKNQFSWLRTVRIRATVRS